MEHRLGWMIGKSPAMVKVRRQIEAFAQERVKEFIQSDIVRSLNIEGIARQLK